MSKSNKDNFKDDEKNLSRRNLPIPDHKETIAELVAEGNRLLEQDEKKPSPVVKPSVLPVPTSPMLSSDSKNPYIKAIIQLLNQWKKDPRTAWKAEEIENMKKKKNTNNRHYDEFVHEVRLLGDTL
jgi:hypothetical protein